MPPAIRSCDAIVLEVFASTLMPALGVEHDHAERCDAEPVFCDTAPTSWCYETRNNCSTTLRARSATKAQAAVR